ncbi:MAG: sterol desaturase family protein [Bdellovibrionales bacterium]|nr:sterol desaturase family protein [Bdellovibrionales bacterium]
MILKPGKDLKLFENPLLNRMTFVHPIMPGMFWLPIATYFFSQRPSLIHFLSGFFLWTFVEYILHRFVFHWEGKWAWSKRLHFLIHGNHHDDPNDQRRILMPILPAIILSLPFMLIFRVTLGTDLWMPFMSGFLVGYLAYDYMHFAVHYFDRPTGFVLRMKRMHMLHHFSKMEAGEKFGVSTPIWDYVFGTQGK